MKDRVIIWTPEEPQGYGVCDQDDEINEEPIEIIYDEEDEEGLVAR